MKDGPKWLKLTHYFSNKTKFVERETPAFMALEISVDALKLTSVGIEQLKSIDNWALIRPYSLF